MKRRIIQIDEALCNGCGRCVSACAEGALQLVNGKARLVRDFYCDGFGDCLGECPTGALTIVERDAAAFDVDRTRSYVEQARGAAGLQQFDAALQRHPPPGGAASEPGRSPAPAGGGCPGMRMRFRPGPAAAAPPRADEGGPAIRPDLDQWPVQLHLVQPGAPCFHGRELLVLSTCAPVASADAHWRFLRGRGVAVACPKLDRTDGYVEKLAGILKDPTIPAVRVVRMEVPCCGGLTAMVREAVRLCGREDLQVEEVILGLDGVVKARAGVSGHGPTP